MPANDCYTYSEERLRDFRQSLIDFLPYRADALLNVIDALCSNTKARSVAELSLNSLFRYQYSSIYDGIDHFCLDFTTIPKVLVEATIKVRSKQDKDYHRKPNGNSSCWALMRPHKVRTDYLTERWFMLPTQ